MKSNTVLFLKTQIEFNSNIILKNIEGISPQESMVFPFEEANCANWIFGHIIFVRNGLLQILDEKPVWNNDVFIFYNRGAKPLLDQEKFLDFEELKTYFHETQNRLMNVFEKLEDFKTDNIPDLAGLGLHEIYHAGQLGYIRRFLGKEGAIK